MESRPTILEKISLKSVHIAGINLNTLKSPDTEEQGFIKYSLGVGQSVEKADQNAPQSSLILKAIAELNAFSGTLPEGDEEPTPDQKLMTCKLDLVVQYDVDGDEISEGELSGLAWHFRPQVAILVREHLRNILRDTEFATIPILVQG